LKTSERTSILKTSESTSIDSARDDLVGVSFITY
jgi:hypothetical protein